MSDVVIQLPVQAGEEAELFGAFLAEFMETCVEDADRWAEDNDAPYLMIRSDPLQDVEVKVVTFQQQAAADAFSSGWDRVRSQRSVSAA